MADFGGDLGSSTFSGSKGAFKPANDISAKLPSGGSTIRGTAGLTQRAELISTKHSTKGLGGPKPFMAKVRPIKNLAKSIGRKRGY